MATTKKKKTSNKVTQPCTYVLQKTGKTETGGKQARQQAFLQAYRASLFNISEACRQVGLARRTFYHWRKDDSFVEELDTCQAELKDFIQSKLLDLVEKNNLIAIIFACKTICKMVETTRQDLTVEHKPFLSNEESDKVIKAGLQSMLTEKKYQKMLGLTPEPDEHLQ